jgi:Ca2+-binding RTX toxin-like protein
MAAGEMPVCPTGSATATTSTSARPANDVLNGDSGHDMLAGGDGDDQLRGYPGSDALLGDAGERPPLCHRRRGRNDALDGGMGTDFCSFDAVSATERDLILACNP